MIRGLAQGIDGLVTIVGALPGQSIRMFRSLPPEYRSKITKAVRERLPMGDTMQQSYYFGNPQIYKMPKKFRVPGPALTPSRMGEFKEGSACKALPYVAIGIAGLVAYNIFYGKKK